MKELEDTAGKHQIGSIEISANLTWSCREPNKCNDIIEEVKPIILDFAPGNYSSKSFLDIVYSLYPNDKIYGDFNSTFQVVVVVPVIVTYLLCTIPMNSGILLLLGKTRSLKLISKLATL